MKTKKLLLVVGSICLAVMLTLPFMAGCAPITPTPVEEPRVVGSSRNPCVVTAPGLGALGAGPQCYFIHVWDGLIATESAKQPDGTITSRVVPVLATGYEWLDDTTIRLKLREGVKFQNGEDFTAEDVKYSFDYYKEMPLGGRYEQDEYMHIYNGCRIIDTYTVELTLEEPNLDAMSSLCAFLVLPKSRGWTEESVAAFNKNPVGTGPYKLKAFRVDEYVELEAWEDYRDGVARPKYVTLKYIPEVMTRFAALITHEVDIIQHPGIEHLAEIERDPDLAISVFSGAGHLYLINRYKPPFDDVRVRQAMNYAIDREAICDKVLEGYSTPLPNLIHGAWLGAIPEMKPYPYDPEKAKQLLAEAGYPEGFEMVLQCTSGTQVKDLEIAQVIQAYWADVGIKATLGVVEDAARLDNFHTLNFDTQASQWGWASYSPWMVVRWQGLLFTEQTEKYGGVEAFPPEIAEIYTLFKEVAGEMDRAKQEELFRQINQLTFDAAVTLPIHAEVMMVPYNKAKMGEWQAVINYHRDHIRFYDYEALYPLDREIVWEEVP